MLCFYFVRFRLEYPIYVASFSGLLFFYFPPSPLSYLIVHPYWYTYVIVPCITFYSGNLNVTINISHICGKMFILEFSFVCLILSTRERLCDHCFIFDVLCGHKHTTFQNREVLYEDDGRWFLHTNMRKHLITKQIVPEEFFRSMWRLKSYINKLLSWFRFYYTSIKQIPA